MSSRLDTISPLIIGGQGTYRDSLFYTEFPDRELSLEYMMEVAVIAQRFKYTHIVPSGGFTQAETPDVSEAESFRNVWDEFGIDVTSLRVVKDEVALDSAENVICGLMAVRLDENSERTKPRDIGRIGFFSQWHFKKRRMTELAKQLGIEKSFYFHGYAPASKAAAGDAAQAGEQRQLDEMISKDDFLLLGTNWEEKRRKRFKKGRYHEDDGDNKKGEEMPGFQDIYDARTAISKIDLAERFREVYNSLESLKRTTIDELDQEAGGNTNEDADEIFVKVRNKKIQNLQKAFNAQIIKGTSY